MTAERKTNRFPNKMIQAAYDSAKNRVFHKLSTDGSYVDELGSKDYNHVALQWLEDRGILERKLNQGPWVFEYRIVK